MNILDLELDSKELFDNTYKTYKANHKKLKKVQSCNNISNAYSFEKQSKRPDLFGKTKENRFAPIYYPDYNYCKKKITLNVTPFHKSISRTLNIKSPVS